MNTTNVNTDLIRQFTILADRLGLEPSEISFLYKDEDILQQVKGLIRGTHEIKVIDHFINCDVLPFCPKEWEIIDHQKNGHMQFNYHRVCLYQTKLQKKQVNLSYQQIKVELANKRLLNANVLDFILLHPNLIPSWWNKDKNGNSIRIFFWGTIYSSIQGGQFVRCLFGDHYEFFSLDNALQQHDYTAILPGYFGIV